MTAVNYARWAIRFQRALDQQPAEAAQAERCAKIDIAMRRRAAVFWGLAEAEGIVIQ